MVLAACGDCDPQPAWQAYADALADGFPNEGELRLFSLIAERLSGDLASQPLAKYLQSARRWARMQAMLNQQLSREIGALFKAEGIPLMWIKGTALVARTDQRRDLRPSADLDALFRWEDVEHILALAGREGWTPHLGLLKNLKQARYVNTELSYKIGAYGELDLQWRPRMAFTYDRRIQSWLWQDPSRVQDATGTTIASDTWLFIEILDHGLVANEVYPIRWLVDAVRLLHWRHENIDWGMVLDIIKRNKLHHHYFSGLESVARYSPHIPPFVMDALRKTPVNFLDREELKARLSAENLGKGFFAQQALNKLRREPSKLYYRSVVNPLSRNMDLSVATRLTFAGRNVLTRVLFPLWYF